MNLVAVVPSLPNLWSGSYVWVHVHICGVMSIYVGSRPYVWEQVHICGDSWEGSIWETAQSHYYYCYYYFKACPTLSGPVYGFANRHHGVFSKLQVRTGRASDVPLPFSPP